MVDQAEIHRKVASGDVRERREAVDQLCDNFADLPDKKEAWKDLIWLTQSDRRWVVRCWHNIKYWLIGDEYSDVRWDAVRALGSAFQYVLDKDVAWDDLIRLTRDGDSDVRWRAVNALGSAFQYVLDKDVAWDDLIRLTRDGDSCVQWRAVNALGSAFQYVLDKDVAWDDLIRLTRDGDSSVRWRTVNALGSAFQYVPDKDVAWEDLIRLTGDEDSDVQVFAYYSLGRVSIFKATQAESEKDFRKYLIDSIEFFGKTERRHMVQKVDITKPFFPPKTFIYYSDPSEFCLPFYRSFYAITFGKAEAKGEVEKYLSKAKSRSYRSKNKEMLLEAVENLANALSEAHNATDFDTKKSDLNSYRRYCDRAADLIGDAKEGAPGAARVLGRGLPIIDKRIKELLEEVKKKSEIICKAADLPESELSCRIGQHAATALATDNPLIVEREIDYILNDLERWSHSIRDENEKEYIQGIIFDAKNGDARGKVSSLRVLVGRLLTFSEDKGEEMPKYDIRDSIVQIAEGNRNVQKMDSSVNSQKAETESGDVTVTTNAKATKELQPEELRTDHRKKTAIEIIAAIAVSVLVGIVSSRYLEDLTSTSSTVIAFIAFIILLTIILTQNRDRSS